MSLFIQLKDKRMSKEGEKKTMNNIKALIKVEFRPAMLMSLYFLIVNIGGLLITGITINNRFIDYLRYGDAVRDINRDIFLPIWPVLLLFILLGIIVLIYFQFKNDKNAEIGRFLKALPFTNVQRCLVKVVAGLLSFSIPFIVFAGGVIALRSYVILQYKEAYSVLPYEQVIVAVNSVENLIYLLVIGYLVYVAVYLFIFMVQYLMNNNIGSLVVSILSAVAPAFIAVSIDGIYRLALNGFRAEILLLPTYGIATRGEALLVKGAPKEEYVYYSYIEKMGLKMLIASLVISLCAVIIYQIAKKAKIEDVDVLIPHSASRWIFVGGVSVCAAFLLADISQFLILPLMMDDITFMTQVMLVIGGIAGFIIAKKIACIGIAPQKKSKYKKIITLVLCSVLFTGCSRIEEQAKAYKAVSYDEHYYKRETSNWTDLEKELLKLEIKDYGRYSFNRMDDNHFFIEVGDIDSEVAGQIVALLKELVGDELSQLIDEVKVIKEERVTREEIIGDYGIVCINDYGNMSISIIQNNIEIIDGKSKDMIEQIFSSDFMLSEMRVGKNNNMIKIDTPCFIRSTRRHGDQVETTSSYQIFRKNTGEIIKVRLVINTFDNKDPDYQEFKSEELVAKHLPPLRNIIGYIEDQETIIEPVILDIKGIYDNEKIKASGKINDINYKINKYGEKNDYRGQLIEVVLEINK